MRFEKPNCPQCGEPVEGTVERLAGCAQLFPTEGGEYEYEGSTEVWWNGQITEKDEDGDIALVCPNGHVWYTPFTDGSTAKEGA